jgi:hypothetical protein
VKSPRRAVREAMVTALQHETSGLNAKLLAVASDHGLDPFEIAWGDDSRQFVQGYLDPAAVDLSQIFEFPGLVLYTTRAEKQPDRAKAYAFAGDVDAQLDFYIELRDGRERDLTENYGECFEDAVIQMMDSCRSVFEAAGVFWNGDIQIEPSPVVMLENGWAQRIGITLTFEVEV